jgi:hypothetical protein
LCTCDVVVVVVVVAAAAAACCCCLLLLLLLLSSSLISGVNSNRSVRFVQLTLNLQDKTHNLIKSPNLYGYEDRAGNVRGCSTVTAVITSNLKTEALSFSENFVSAYISARCPDPENHI